MSSPIPVITQHQVAGLLHARPHDSHKGIFGTVGVIGGAAGMIGAALLAGRAALKMGAGCVHVVLLADNAPTVDLVQPELMLHKADFVMPAPDYSIRGQAAAGIQFDKNAGFPLSRERQILVVGCGMGCDMSAQKYLYDALHSEAALVLDADALTILAQRPDLHTLLRARGSATVLTPHPGEAARLLNCSSAEVQADRAASAQILGRMFGCTLVLKGADSLCVTRDARLFMNNTGNPGMSAPGMGDVLTGMIAAFIAQGLSADDALLLAVHLHGAAGDELAKCGITVGMTATELTGQARTLLNLWLSN